MPFVSTSQQDPDSEVARAAGVAVRVRGLVQGVGFRPTVWRLAVACGLDGEVCNDGDGVAIRIWGGATARRRFLRRLCAEAPPLARIDHLHTEPVAEMPPWSGFHIRHSHSGAVHTGVVPDAATCAACCAEIRDPTSRRSGYAFTNCTHCGPRLSIVHHIPYDRASTTMAAFQMCARCAQEYRDPADRRFHAQPIACASCGPQLWMETGNGVRLAAGEAIARARQLLRQGRILAVKGLGGFHLAVDAGNVDAVHRLRQRKHRLHKPFALMARDVAVIRRYCQVSDAEQALLESAAAPVVLLAAVGPEALAPGVAPAQRGLGFMLPYTPLHHLLLEDCDQPIVLTSGNRCGEPPCTDNQEARTKLGDIADCFLIHDREIVNRVDDSVSRMLDGAARLLRRARGHAPAPLTLPAGFEPALPLLAMGGELKNTFCLVRGGEAILSQHMGDLEDAATLADYRRNLARYRDLFQVSPELIAVDCHPEYLSSKLGWDYAAREGQPVTTVQHHHAHVAACLAENRVSLTEGPALGIALDGSGFGDDGTWWGGEFLLADYMRFTRLGHFSRIPLLGGAQAIREPWRSLYGHLVESLGWQRCATNYGGVASLAALQQRPLATLDAMLSKGVNCPETSSCGRLFDAVAAAVGICGDGIDYEGQAAMELEALVDEAALDGAGAGYPFGRSDQGAMAVLDCATLWPALLDDLAKGTSAAVVAARFHLGLAAAVVSLTEALAARADVPTGLSVALSGGVFQNRVLFEQVAEGLRRRGFTVLSHRLVPSNDGGLSLGQAAVAAARALSSSHDEVFSCA